MAIDNNDRGTAGRRDLKTFALRAVRNEHAVLIAVLVVLVAVLAALTKGASTRWTNVENVLVQSATRGLASIGQAFVVLTGGIDVSVGGVGLFASALGASLITSSADQNLLGTVFPLGVGILVMLMAGTAAGAINGLAVSRIGLPPLIATLAMWQIGEGLGFVITQGFPVENLPKQIAFWGSGTISGLATPVVLFIVTASIAYFFLNHTSYGRSVYAVGGNSVSAWLSGVDVKRIRASVYVISGFLAGLAGVVFTGRVESATMKSLLGLELDSIAAVFIGGVSIFGGRGSVIGVVIGVMILGVINNAMSILNAETSVQLIVKGSIIFTAVALDNWRNRR